MTQKQSVKTKGKTLLLTAFEPFGGAQHNTALDAVRRVPERSGGFEIVRLTVPTVFEGCVPVVLQAVSQTQPDVVLMVGQAAGRGALTPERAAVNRMHARIPDNAGFCPAELPIVPGGPERCASTLPVDGMVRAILAAGVPAEASDDAGKFVCNRLLYGVLYALAQQKAQIRAGFLHVPLCRELAAPGQPSLPLQQIVEGLSAAIDACSLQTDPAVLY